MVGLSWLHCRSRRIHRFAICLLVGFLLLTSCKKDRTPELFGAWQATLLIEEGDTVDVILDDVGLYFDEAGNYIYTSTLDYEESGTFRTSGDILFTTPMKQDTLSERPVAIAFLTEKSLHLNMKEGEKNRILEFERVDQNTPENSMSSGHEGHEHTHDGHEHDDDFHESEFEGIIDSTGIDEIND